MLAGEPYLADDKELVADRNRCRIVLARLNATSMAESGARDAVLRELLGLVGDGLRSCRRFTATTATRSRSGRGRSSTSAP